jgi:sulfatase maturation enzyme AslB (radical SAM superfamily)
MDGLSALSVYNVPDRRLDRKHCDGPLAFLRGDDERGWRVARNLRKPLNHLDFLRKQEAIATWLNLHNVHTDRATFDLNYRLLGEHQSGSFSTSSLIEPLVAQLDQEGRGMPEKGVRRLLNEYATVCHIEFHPSDLCNLTCQGCTYGHDDPETKLLPVHYPIRHLKRIAQLKPKSMVIIGGGEPTLYRQGPHHFQDLVDGIREQVPGIALALVTNGTYRPAGDWPNWFSWIRLSLDAATQETYRDFRGRPMFDRVIKNFLSYLDDDVPHVGISFLFSKANIHEYTAVARFIFELVQSVKPQHLHKVNIQYRPLRRYPWNSHRPFAEAITDQDIRRTVSQVVELGKQSPEMEAFLREQTNITAVLGGNTHPPHEFSRCYYSQTFKIVRANGDLRPCFIRVTEPDFLLGNIVRDSPERIALNTLYVAAKRISGCSARGCRQCHVNYVFEQGLAGRMQPSTSPEVLADPMF